jgi:predicted RNA binding protein YcfA (HicA-like mRNA interferase family)
MGLKDLPLARGEKHVAAFQHAGWVLVRIKGSHRILERDGVDAHLSIPCHAGKDVKRTLVRSQIRTAGMTEDEYLDHFYERVPRVPVDLEL